MRCVQNKTANCIQASGKARRGAFRRIARPSAQLLGGAAHYCPRCIENSAFEADTHRFYQIANTTWHKNFTYLPAARPGDVPLGASPGPASGKALGAADCYPRCIENWALQTNMHRYLRFANTIRKKNKGSACLPRPGEAPLGAPPGPASGKPLGAARCRPRRIENWALQANMYRFLRFANTIRKKNKCSACPPRPGDAPFSASPGPACGVKET